MKLKIKRSKDQIQMKMMMENKVPKLVAKLKNKIKKSKILQKMIWIMIDNQQYQTINKNHKQKKKNSETRKYNTSD